jgi:hypothetical protein
MSIRTELEEVVKWISELSAKKEQEPAESPSRELWQAVGGDLRQASKKFGKARVALSAKARVEVVDNDTLSRIRAMVLRLRSPVVVLEKVPGAIVAEFAGDLEREAESLELRAYLLSRRALPKPKPKTELTKPKPLPPVTEAAPTEAPATGALPATVTVHEQEEQPGQQPAPRDLVKSAGGQVEKAHRHLEAVKSPDLVTKAFEEDLDVLADMTLSLWEQCKRLEEERTEVQG